MHISEMEEKFPEAFVQFKQVCETLEKHYRDMQDMEFTVEHGKLYMLQTRNGKRTAKAALKIACDLQKHLEHLRELLAVRSYSQLTML